MLQCLIRPASAAPMRALAAGLLWQNAAACYERHGVLQRACCNVAHEATFRSGARGET